MSRPYVRAHEPMLLEYLNRTYPVGTWRTNVRLGRPHPELEAMALTAAERRMIRIVTYRADAVVLLENKVVILEVATEPRVDKICQLKLYGHLFGVTEEYHAHWKKPRELIVVASISNDFIAWFSRNEGVAWIVYRPIWMDEHEAIRAARRFAGPAMEPPTGEESP